MRMLDPHILWIKKTGGCVCNTLMLLLSLACIYNCDDTAVIEPPTTDPCGNDPRDVYVAGLEKEGIQGRVKIRILDADPAPPDLQVDIDYNVWTIALVDMDDQVLEGASIVVTPSMPQHNHGTVPDPTVIDEGEGIYTVSHINLFMPGVWLIAFDITLESGETDTLEYNFCCEG